MLLIFKQTSPRHQYLLWRNQISFSIILSHTPIILKSILVAPTLMRLGATQTGGTESENLSNWSPQVTVAGEISYQVNTLLISLSSP